VLRWRAFYGLPKVFDLKFLGDARSQAVSGVKGAEEAPAIMQSPNHWGKLKSRPD